MQFDLLIIGTGTAAMVAPVRVRDAGWSVAVIDDKPFGGTCALRGCDPKKMLVAGAEGIDAQRRMSERGVESEVRFDWPDLIGFKRTFTDRAGETRASLPSQRHRDVPRCGRGETMQHAMQETGVKPAAQANAEPAPADKPRATANAEPKSATKAAPKPAPAAPPKAAPSPPASTCLPEHREAGHC